MKKTILLCTLLAGLNAQAQVPGTLDAAFGDNGIVKWTATPGTATYMRDLRLLNDGKIIASGQVNGSNLDMILGKFNASGANDSSLQGLNYSMFDPFLGADDNMYCMDVMVDGKILLGGYQQGTNDNDVIVYKINADGSIDNTWGTQGRVLIDAGGYESAMKIKAFPDGKILIGCTRYVNNNSNMLLIRLNADGTPDATFSGDGISHIVFVGMTAANLVDMEVLPGGNIIVCGTVSDGVLAQVGMAKINPAGIGMPVFGTNSKVKFAMDGKSSQAMNLCITKNYKMVVCGVYQRANNDEAGIMMMLDTNGIMDNVFGAGKGVIAYDKTALAEDEEFTDVIELSNGHLFAIANYTDIDNKKFLLGVMFGATGNLRLDFGNSGIVQYQAGDGYTFASAVSIVPQPDGKILIGGTAKNTGNNKNEFLLYRLNMENKATNSIAGIEKQSTVSVYPNPATATFNIASSTKPDMVWMMDATGRTVAQWNTADVQYAIPESLSNGVYYIKLKAGNNYSSIQLQVNR